MFRHLLADGVMLLHFGYVVFVAVGGFIAWRWPRALYVHLVAVAWAIGIVVVGFSCPLTNVEQAFRGDGVGTPGFIDRYIEGILYPEALTPLLRAAVGLAVVASYAGWIWRRLAPRSHARAKGGPSSRLPQVEASHG
ncbi:MAG: DUF2784 domain-containing protein [Acidimicrobiia bacterium]